MAKTKIDEALYDGLQQAKKKSRYYCVVVKATDVVGLVVQKKPILEGQAQKIKTERKGTLLIQGVCHGNATDLTLEVLEAEPNLPTKKVKDFVSAATELTVKPQWLVVPQFTPVVDEENDAPAAPQRPASNAPATPQRPATSAPARPTSPPPDAGSLPTRLTALVARYQAVIQATPALRDKLLPFAQAAGTAVTSGNPTALVTVDKFEQALTLVERVGQQAPPRPAQGPGGNVAPPPRPSQGPPTGSPPTGRGGARPSLFERAKQRLKKLGSDVEKQAESEGMRCSAALDSVGFAIDKLVQDNPDVDSPQIAEFSRQQFELQVKLQQLWEAPRVDPKGIGSVRKEAEYLERQVQVCVDESASYQQTLHDLSQRLQKAREAIEDARKNAAKSNKDAEIAPIIETYLPLLATAEKEYERAVKELNSTGELGAVTQKVLAEQDKKLQVFGGLGVFPMAADLQARRVAMIDRAQNDPTSDAARLAEAFGGVPGMVSQIGGVLMRQQQRGINLRDLAASGQTLTDEEIVGLYMYTDEDFVHMNGYLLFPEKYQDDPARLEQIKIKNEFCLRGLKKLADYPSICYPVIRFESGDYDWQKVYVEGQIFQNKQFWSTGATAGAWIKNPQQAALKFRIYGKTGKDIAAFAKNVEGTKEQALPQLAALGKGEVLFAPDCKFRVMSVVESDKKVYDLPTYNITLLEE